MSDFVVVARPDTRLTPSRRVAALVAVACARYLARQAPAEIERKLRYVSRAALPASMDETLAAHKAITTVSTRCAGRWCLDRSIAVALLLRMSGVWPEWHTGVCLLPFRAHAWVEVDGQPVGEPTGLKDNFQSLLTVSAGRTPS